MLAVEAKPEKLQYPLLAQPKLDGFRAMVKDGELVSRNLKPIRNKNVQSFYGHEMFEGFDGELIHPSFVAPNVFQMTSTLVTTINLDVKPDQICYCVFDIWDTPDLSYKHRYELLNSRLKEYQLDVKIVPIKQQLVHNESELRQVEDHYLNLGFEGLILRCPNSPYKYNRSTVREGYLLKLKRFVDDEAIIIGFEERYHNANEATVNALGYTERSTVQANKKPMGTLGALKVKDKDGREFNIGTGFDDSLRQKIWDDQGSYLNKLVTFKHFAQAGVVELPRFPVFKGFRDEQDCEFGGSPAG